MALALACAMLAALAPVAPALAQEAQPPVNVIEVRGLYRIDEASVRARITQQLGGPLDSDGVSADLQSIYKMGYFDDVRVEIEPFEGGVKLIYVIREKPIITRVHFEGNKKIDSDKLKEKVTITPGSIADTVLIQSNADTLSAFYAAKGYALAEVVPVVRRINEQQAVLTYQIDEGRKVRVKKIIIDGNKKISNRKIKGVMKTEKWWLFSFITKGGHYERGVLQADIENIKKLYFDNGYIQASVSDPEVKLNEKKRSFTVIIKVFEGEQFSLSKVGFSGNSVYSEEELRKGLKSKSGKIFSRTNLESDIAGISEKYNEKGYAAVNVVPEVIPDEVGRTVDLTYRVEEGEIYKVGRINISGNIRTRDKVIRREVRLNEGETFNGKKLVRSYQRIQNTKFFEELKLEPDLDHELKEVDLNIDVKERKTGSISVGVGYSSVDSLVGTIELKQGNLGGRGQNLNIKAEAGGVSTLFSVSFTDPWFLDYPVAFSASVFRTEREYPDYRRRATGFTLGLTKEIAEYWRAGITYEFSHSVISDVLDTASTVIKDQTGEAITSSITPAIVRDSRDNVLRPHKGSRIGFDVTYAGLGGDNKFLKSQLVTSLFIPVTKSTTVALRGNWGYATGAGGRTVPLYERFYVGGVYTVRGIAYGEAGPRDINGEPIGGLKKMIYNAEFIFPISERLKFDGVIFFDAGAAWDDDFDGLRYTTGAGVRWISPFGPLRLEWGYNLKANPGEDKSRWEFAVGSFF